MDLYLETNHSVNLPEPRGAGGLGVEAQLHLLRCALANVIRRQHVDAQRVVRGALRTPTTS